MMVLRGYRFGLLLQIAVGPVFLFVLKTATESGVLAAEAAVVAATIVDAIYVTLAIIGVGLFLDKPKVKDILRYFGTFILVYFGVGSILGSFGIHIIPGFGNILLSANISSAFIISIILTASSPLTILFWTGVFATKMTQKSYNKTDMKMFGFGAVLSTLTSLGAVGLAAGLLHPIMTQKIISMLNILVGIIISVFGVKMLFSKGTPSVASSE